MISFSACACYSVKNLENTIVEELIRHYADHLRGERNVSPHTLRNYLSDLVQFNQFLVERELCLKPDGTVDVHKVDIHVARTYLAALTKNRKKELHGPKTRLLERVLSLFGRYASH